MESTGLHTTNTASISPQPNVPNTGLIIKQELVFVCFYLRNYHRIYLKR
jgi:hypothetical protein